MKVVVVGAGRVGTAVAVLLRRAGHELVAVTGREASRERAAVYLPGVPFLQSAAAVALGELVLVGTPDDAIGATVSAF
ncbi:MAG: Gfo/Idh/MocA family oxidoreductase, partial [Actinomycetota bacterium]